MQCGAVQPHPFSDRVKLFIVRKELKLILIWFALFRNFAMVSESANRAGS